MLWPGHDGRGSKNGLKNGFSDRMLAVTPRQVRSLVGMRAGCGASGESPERKQQLIPSRFTIGSRLQAG
jgi:hypothetical protein